MAGVRLTLDGRFWACDSKPWEMDGKKGVSDGVTVIDADANKVRVTCKDAALFARVGQLPQNTPIRAAVELSFGKLSLVDVQPLSEPRSPAKAG